MIETSNMTGFTGFKFFLFVLLFAGSIVLISAQQLRKLHIRNQGMGDPGAARSLIHSLRGEILSQSAKGKEFSIAPEDLPARKSGEILQPDDRKELNSVLRGILPSN